jgi:hypothetical protein
VALVAHRSTDRVHRGVVTVPSGQPSNCSPVVVGGTHVGSRASRRVRLVATPIPRRRETPNVASRSALVIFGSRTSAPYVYVPLRNARPTRTVALGASSANSGSSANTCERLFGGVGDSVNAPDSTVANDSANRSRRELATRTVLNVGALPRRNAPEICNGVRETNHVPCGVVVNRNLLGIWPSPIPTDSTQIGCEGVSTKSAAPRTDPRPLCKHTYPNATKSNCSPLVASDGAASGDSANPW